MNNKIKLAFVKFGGLAAGGAEKFLQNLAMSLPPDRFDITYFYCDAAPYIGSDWVHPDTDANRLKLMMTSNVKLVKFNVRAKDVTIPTHDWVETDLWEHFNESDFDIVQTARSGHPEYPFTKILNTPIVDSIHLPGHVDHQANIAAVIHVSEWNKNVWVGKGGAAHLATVIYPPLVLPTELPDIDYRKELGLEGKFVFGMHQRANDGIYSHIPLAAYHQAQTDDTAFVLLGGSKLYRQQAEKLNLKNFHHLPETGDMGKVCCFLKALNVYTHGRADGENNSQSIAEAMAFGLPIVSHLARANGHVETIGDAGKVVCCVQDYAVEMLKLIADKEYRNVRSANAVERFKTKYDLKTNMQKFVDVYERVYEETKTNTTDDEWLNDWLDDEKHSDKENVIRN